MVARRGKPVRNPAPDAARNRRAARRSLGWLAPSSESHVQHPQPSPARLADAARLLGPWGAAPGGEGMRIGQAAEVADVHAAAGRRTRVTPRSRPAGPTSVGAMWSE